MYKTEKEIEFLLKKIANSTDDDYWLPNDALVFILFEYYCYEITSAIFRLSRIDQIKIADKLHDLDEIAFRNGLSLKLKNIEANIESTRLRYFWGYKWLQNACILLGGLMLWGIGRWLDGSTEAVLFIFSCYLIGLIKKSSYEVFRQNELMIQEMKLEEFEKEKARIKENLKAHDWFI